MENTEDDYTALLEALTLERVLVPAETPPWWGGFVGDPKWWSGSTFKSRTAGYDIVYLNTDGKKHRLSGPAYISTIYDIEIWFKNDEFHRDNGPAIRHKSTFWWFKEGKPHNLHGPAHICAGGPSEYWIDGVKMSKKEYRRQIQSKHRRGLIK